MSDTRLKHAATFAATAALGFASGALLWRLTSCNRSAGGHSVNAVSPQPVLGTFSLQDIVRPNIASLVPYRCARDDYDSGILLDANENSMGSPLPLSITDVCATHLERYPSPYQWELRELYGRWRSVAKEQVFVGVGSDEAIDMIIRMVCVPRQDSVLVLEPTYGASACLRACVPACLRACVSAGVPA